VNRLHGGVVVDASVGVKFVVPEGGHETARAVLDQSLRGAVPTAFPDFASLEVANALWVKTRRRELTSGLARASLALFMRVTLRFIRVPERVLAVDALEIALDHGLTAYDGCYLALARRMGLPLLSADVKLATAGVRRKFDVILLSELGDG